MLSLGILNDSPTKFNKNILNIKLNVFKFLNTILYNKDTLFPPLSRSSFPGLVSRGAVACAADDLELFSSNTFDFSYDLGTSNYNPSTGIDNSLLAFKYGGVEPKQKYERYASLEEPYDFYSSSEGFVSPEEDDSWKSGFKKRKCDEDASTASNASSEAAVSIKYQYDMDPMSYNNLSLYDVDRLFNDLIQDLPKSQPYHHGQTSHQLLQSITQPNHTLHSVPDYGTERTHSHTGYTNEHQTYTNYAAEQEQLETGKLLSQPHSMNGEKTKNTKINELLKYKCPHCEAKFKVKGYLTRHIKKHNTLKAFKCPFYEEPRSETKGTKCHPTGGFSRRDTYKTHLKALHFIYPPGTKSSERSSISGRCAGCFQYFENNMKWLENHIENGEGCQGSVNNAVKEEFE
ncbi:uncharacterized protein AC631_05493 [Debaryomyces fabryi]|uniref:C2H2-type domain-containing protein n=1 Tax=Debaryomyces fabryi TaxID=58627 RepID=A0A0V1PRG9_9ASCO|nr:uncharacterized protein AC631_05493 [Debaryomyces fabryi]KRZ98745.1 hypothetical protein AC631_05493 [Debaryomyces fabryi]CUM46674.1 unnamed protein product [Debaryomyces fabryi]